MLCQYTVCLKKKDLKQSRYTNLSLTICGSRRRLCLFQVKAGLRTLIPIEQKYIEEEPRVSKQVHHEPNCVFYHSALFLSVSTTAPPILLNCLKQNQQPWWVASCKAQQLCGQDTTGWLKEKQHFVSLFFSSLSSSPSSLISTPSHPLWVVNRNVKLSALGCISRLAILIVGPLCHCCFALHCHAAQCGGTTKRWIVGAGPHQTCHMSDRLGSAVSVAPRTAEHSPA